MNTRKIFTLALVMVSTILLYGSVVGQSLNQKIDIAQMSNNGSNISWIIKVPYESATLTVSAPNGEVFRREFNAGSILIFSPITERGEYFGNGQFNYQIVLTPNLSPSVKEALEQSRIDGNSDEVRADFARRGMLPAEMVESGTFTVLNGNIITGSSSEKETEKVRASQGGVNNTPNTKTPPTQNAGDIPVENAQVITQDLVVQGSECVGVDCANGLNFGFDTLILKENNLRLFFDDTSNTASFPKNDWRLVANDTTNGGANRFSIEDATAGKAPFTIIAGAPSNSLFVDGSGKIGIKTSTPVTGIHQRDGNTPTLRLEQDGSSGFTPYTWDIAGNETNFFIRDVSNGSKLPLRIRPGAPTDSLEIRSDGTVRMTTGLEVKVGTSFLPVTPGGSIGASSAQQFYGGQAINTASSTIPPVYDTNSFAITTGSGNGGIIALLNVPANSNLANTTATHIVYKIRYQDPDGSGTASFVTLQAVANNIDTGVRSDMTIFSSNSFGATGVNTVTTCVATDTTYFNYETHATHLVLTLFSSGANTKLLQIQIYKTNGCP